MSEHMLEGEDDFPDAYDIYTYDKYQGTLALIDDTLVMSGWDHALPTLKEKARLQQFIDMARDSGAKSDREIFIKIADLLQGITHIRSVGNAEGINEPFKVGK